MSHISSDKENANRKFYKSQYKKRYVTSSMNTLMILMLDIKNLILCHGTLYEDFIVFKNKVNYITSNRNVVTDTKIQAQAV